MSPHLTTDFGLFAALATGLWLMLPEAQRIRLAIARARQRFRR